MTLILETCCLLQKNGLTYLHRDWSVEFWGAVMSQTYNASHVVVTIAHLTNLGIFILQGVWDARGADVSPWRRDSPERSDFRRLR